MAPCWTIQSKVKQVEKDEYDEEDRNRNDLARTELVMFSLLQLSFKRRTVSFC